MRLSLLFSLGAIVVQAVSSMHKTAYKEPPKPNLAPYEYVVVGSGPGGGPLAARLAIAGFRVLLLDAGDDQGASPVYQIPLLNLAAAEYPATTWSYYVNHYSDVTKQKMDSKMTYRTKSGEFYIGLNPPKDSKPMGILYPRAGTLGGCAAHNALVAVYPYRSDWAYIAKVTGDRSWEPTAMRKYFERLEDASYLPKGNPGHGYGGWFTTSLSDPKIGLQDSKLRSIIIAASAALGQKIVRSLSRILPRLGESVQPDANADTFQRDSTEGIFQFPMSAKDGARISPREFVLATANALNPDGSRKYYLDIQLETLVTKVRFSTTKNSKPRAVGVDFLKGKSLYRADSRSATVPSGIPGSVDATREVILSGGAFNTPQLLKLSGIGPVSELNKFQIPVVLNLPGVGTNLQDRYETSVIAKSTSNTKFSAFKGCTRLQTPTDPCLVQWETNAGGGDRGIYASNGRIFGIVKKSSVSSGDADLIISGSPVNFPGYYQGYSTNATASGQHFSLVVLKAHTCNTKGTVQLASKDPRDMPLINFNNFPTSDPHGSAKDLQAVVEGMEFSRKIFKSVVPLDGSFEEVWPGKSITGGALKDFIQNEAWGHHASCTCPIGRDDDPLAVLDSAFRVRGTLGLRVVDATVFPKIPGYYLVVPTYMISEKAADVILAAARS